MKIDREEARHIARLARLQLEDAALDRMAAEMTKILGYIDQLKDVPAGEADVAEQHPPTPMRADEVSDGTPRQLVERNAPSWDNGFFVVPKVIE